MRTVIYRAACAALATLALAGCGSGNSGDSNKNSLDTAELASQNLLKGGGNGDDWAAVGYNYDEKRFSPLNQINDSNVGQLGIAWFADLEDARGQEATPVVIDGRPGELIGRVSMDMLTIDLTDHPQAGLGSKVELWGPNLPVAEVAARSGNSPYRLLTGLKRVPRLYVESR